MEKMVPEPHVVGKLFEFTSRSWSAAGVDAGEAESRAHLAAEEGA